MPLPFNLQKLPPEALDLLRFMGKFDGAASTDDMEEQSGLSARLIGKSIRRLINYDYIVMNVHGQYELTTDGKVAVQELAVHDAGADSDVTLRTRPGQVIPRRLTVVIPRTFIVNRPTDMYFGVNPPTPENPTMSDSVQIELRISSIGGKLSGSNVSLDVPPDRAAAPGKLSLTPTQLGKMIRVRVDAFQSVDITTLEPLGGMYFDVPVATDADPIDSTSRAVGMDLMIRSRG
jgi:hypothetical protein